MEEIAQGKEELPKKQARTGLYSRVNVRKLDFRTRLGKHIRALLKEFYRDLGGEQNVSTQVRVILEDCVIPQVMALRSFTFWLAKSEFGGIPSDRHSRYWIALVNSLRLHLCSIGLQRRMKDITPLAERLAALAERSAGKEGDNGQG